jgi:plasmid stabilization system protein ParE
MKSFEVTEAARTDLIEIWDYIRADNIAAADKVIHRLHDTFVKLGRNPMLGHLREDLADSEHRFFLVYSYMVVYLAAEKPIQNVRVLYAARDVQSILDLSSDER